MGPVVQATRPLLALRLLPDDPSQATRGDLQTLDAIGQGLARQLAEQLFAD